MLRTELEPSPWSVLPSSPSQVVMPPSEQFSNQSSGSSFIFPHSAYISCHFLRSPARSTLAFHAPVLASHSQMQPSLSQSPPGLPVFSSPPTPIQICAPTEAPERNPWHRIILPQCCPTKFQSSSVLCCTYESLHALFQSLPPSPLSMVSQKLSSL